MPFKSLQTPQKKAGCSLRRLYSKRHLVSSRKSTAYKFPGTKGCLAGTKKVPVLSTGESRSTCHRQHYSCGIHKQGGRYEVRLTLCSSMDAPVLVQSETCCPKGQTRPRLSECDCRQIISTRPNNSDGMVSTSGGIRPPVSNLAPSPGRHVCDQVCVSSTRSQCLGSGCSNSLLGELGHVCLFPSIVAGQSGQQTFRSSVQEGDPDSSGLAHHAVVLGSGGSVVPDNPLPTQSSRSGDPAF